MSQVIAYTVADAFTSVPFHGNPAAVIVLDPKTSHNLTDALFQKIAAEFNLSQTAFITPVAQSPGTTFDLRWFSPTVEIRLCGHATMATSRVLFSDTTGLVAPDAEELTFRTRASGELRAKKVPRDEAGVKDQIQLEFPAASTEAVDDALAAKVTKLLRRAFGDEDLNIVNIRLGCGGPYTGYALIEVDEAFDLENARVADVSALTDLDPASFYGVIVTSSRPNTENPQANFISRFFAPHLGVVEDPVCGSAHCVLAPYWSDKLAVPNGQVLHARQVSPRGGNVDVVFDRERGVVKLRGESVIVSKGELYV